jgi:SagB-type dehydrogenase family enzyme
MAKTIELPNKRLNEQISLAKTLEKRSSCRYFNEESLTLQDLSNLLWAAQGITDKRYSLRRTVPSAGAVYPIEMYISVRKEGVHELDKGIYHYIAETHSLEKVSESDITEDLSNACYNQEFITKASFNILLASNNQRTRELYHERGDRYILMEAGAITQNIYLEAVELNLGTVFIGAFDDAMVKALFGIEALMPLAIMPVGMPSDKKFYT